MMIPIRYVGTILYSCPMVTPHQPGCVLLHKMRQCKFIVHLDIPVCEGRIKGLGR